MTILDSNIWIALFHKEDSQHPKAQALMKKLPMPIETFDRQLQTAIKKEK
ncbi:MAG: hypothetical protein WC654_01120 [Patescibacteria group bacterium]